jgi:dCTP deaminase
MILEDSQIEHRIQSNVTDPYHPGSLSVDPIIDLQTQLQPASLDIRIGDQTDPDCDLMIVEDHEEFCMYGKEPKNVRPCPYKGEEWHIPPRSFLLGSSYERVQIPYDLVSRVEGRSTSGRSGLIIHATAGFIDPGFAGDITYEIFNFRNSTMRLPFRQRIGQLVFYELGSRPDNPYGQGNNKYQNQSGVTFAKSDNP